MLNELEKYNLIEVLNLNDIPKFLLDTPISELLKYHNLNYPFKEYEKAQIAIVMCMDNRKQLKIPDRFAYILRTAGARITGNEFKLSFAIGFGDIKHVVLIGHTNCGMVSLMRKKEIIIKGLVENAGWAKEQAENHFNSFAPLFEIENEVTFVVSESKRLQEQYLKIIFVPMIYKVEDHRLYLIEQ